jgi:hypothetical protein
VSMWSARSEARRNDIDIGVAAATPLTRGLLVAMGLGLDRAPGRGWWADRQTDVGV